MARRFLALAVLGALAIAQVGPYFMPDCCEPVAPAPILSAQKAEEHGCCAKRDVPEARGDCCPEPSAETPPAELATPHGAAMPIGVALLQDEGERAAGLLFARAQDSAPGSARSSPPTRSYVRLTC